MKIGKSETDNVYVCYCMLREMHPGKHQTERLRKVTEALGDDQAFYEKREALMAAERSLSVLLLFMKKDSEKHRKSLQPHTASAGHYFAVTNCRTILCPGRKSRWRRQA